MQNFLHAACGCQLLALIGILTSLDTISPLIVGRRCGNNPCSLKARVSDCFKPILVADNVQGHRPLQARDPEKVCLGAFYDGNGPVLTACEIKHQGDHL